MSVDGRVPDESGSGGEAIFWSVVILIGLAAFLYDFLRVAFRDVPAAQPIQIIHDFQQTMFVIAILGGGITVALIAYAIFAFGAGRRTRALMPNVRRGQFMLSVFAIGTAFLMVMTMFVGAATLVQTDEASAETAAEDLDVDRTLEMDVTGSQWFWRFDVDGIPTAQGERVVVPAETVVNVEITSADVIHSFAIQELGVKKDALPGQVNQAWFLVESVEGETTIVAGDEELPADTYTVTCAELCGKGHSTMLATVYVVSPEDYEHWVESKNGTVPESFHAEEGGDGHAAEGDGGHADEGSEDGHDDGESGDAAAGDEAGDGHADDEAGNATAGNESGDDHNDGDAGNTTAGDDDGGDHTDDDH